MRHAIVTQALELLACETRETDLLSSPDVVRDYLRLMLGDRPHEAFEVVFLNAQNWVIATEKMCRGCLTQTSVYPDKPGFFMVAGRKLNPAGQMPLARPPPQSPSTFFAYRPRSLFIRPMRAESATVPESIDKFCTHGKTQLPEP